MKQIQMTVIEVQLAYTRFDLSFTVYPTREQLAEVLAGFWRNLTPRAQDAAFDMLVIADYFPRIELLEGTVIHSLAGNLKVRKLRIWDNGQASP